MLKTTLNADGNRKSPVWAGSTAGARGLEGSEVAVTAPLLTPGSGSRPAAGRKSAASLPAPRGGSSSPLPPGHALRDVAPSPPRRCPNALDSQIARRAAQNPGVSACVSPSPAQTVTHESRWERGWLPELPSPPREVPAFVAVSGPLLKTRR